MLLTKHHLKRNLANNASLYSSIYEAMLGALTCISFSDRYNAIYDSDVFHKMMIKAVMAGSNLTSVVRAARDSVMTASAKSPRIPTAEWFRQRTKDAELGLVAGCINEAISRQVAIVKAAGRFPKRPVVAIDKHLIPRYDKKWEGKLVRSKRKGGTNVFETYITAQCVNARSRLNLAVLHVTQISINADSVRKLIESVQDTGVKPSLILLDREFYSTDVIKTLDSMGMRYLIPCINTNPIKKALAHHASTGSKKVSKMSISNPEKVSASYYGVIVPRKRVSKKKKKKKNLKPEEKFIAFATNVRWIDVEKYAIRWGIETGYRMIEKTRVKTASTGVAPRMIYFAYTLLLYNMWVCANVETAQKSRWDGKPIITQITFLETLLRIIFNVRPEPEPPP